MKIKSAKGLKYLFGIQILLLILASPLYAQSSSGADGDLTVTSEFISNEVITVVSASNSAGQNSLQVSSATGFSAGDEILIISMQDSIEDLSINVAGRYELNHITSISNNTLVLDNTLTYAYNTDRNQIHQVIRVPNYKQVTVESGGSITASAWDGETGGIVVFRADSLLVNSGGKIDVSGTGYRAGAPNEGGGQFLMGYSGESYLGYPAGPSSNYTDINGGGGASGDYRNGGGTNQDGTGGGGGGSFGSKGTEGKYGGASIGGFPGEVYGIVTLTKLFLGSGGGGTGVDDNWGNVGAYGGAGGGIVLIFTDVIIDLSIECDGQNGLSPTGTDGGSQRGGGGAGSGGSIYLQTTIARNISGLSAAGGTGGIGISTGGKGGYGGNGYIRIDTDTITNMENVFPIALIVIDQADPNIWVNSDSLEFSSNIGDTSRQVLVVSNFGNETLTISSISIDNSNFSTTETGFSLDKNETRDISIFFHPADKGEKTGLLTLNSNDPDESSKIVSLHGSTITQIAGGYIAQDSVWTKNGSPYVISGDVIVNSGVTLTIEPGVEVLFERGDQNNVSGWDWDKINLLIEGRLIAVGTIIDTIRFADKYGSRDGNQNGSWARIVISGGSSRAEFEYVSIKHANYEAIFQNWSDSLTITHCSFENNGTGIYFQNKSNPDSTGSILIENNSFSNNNRAIQIYYQYGDLELKYNDFIGSTWMDIYTHHYIAIGNNLRLRYNNFYNQTNNTIIYNDWGTPIDARYNYWGTETTTEINTGDNPKDLSRIEDYYNDNNRGKVDYSHWLSSPYPGGTPAAETTYSAELLITDSKYTDEMLTYKSGESIYLQITDLDRNTDTTIPEKISLKVWSDKENTAETITLTETDNETGIFRGNVALDDNSPTVQVDGSLQVNHGDWMYFEYIDPANDWGNPDTLINGKIFELNIINGYDGQSITGDTVWTKANSPYLLTGDVNINNGSLTIESGVRVYFEPHRDDNNWHNNNKVDITIDQNTSFKAIGTESDSIFFLAYSLKQKPSLWGTIHFRAGNTEIKDRIIQYARIEGGYNGAVSGVYYQLLNSYISNNRYGLYVDNGDANYPAIIRHNTITRNLEWGLHSYGYVIFEYNKIFNNRNGLYFNSRYLISHFGPVKIRYNSIYSDDNNWGNQFQIGYGSSGQTLDAKFNYWGAATTAEMDAGNNPKDISNIHDYYNDKNYGIVNYSRWLDAPWPDGTPAPGGFSGDLQFTHSDRTEAWGFRTEDTLFVQLNDPDLNTDINTPDVASVNIWSGLEQTPELLSLNEVASDTGLFRGWMLLDQSTGFPMTDGVLQVDANNRIFSSYLDALDDWNNTNTIFVDSVIFNKTIQEYTADENTVLLLHLNEGSGQVVSDSSGNNIDGYLGGSSNIGSDDPNWVEGLSGTGIHTGSGGNTNSYIRIPGNSAFDVSGGSITLEAWVLFPNNIPTSWFLYLYYSQGWFGFIGSGNDLRLEYPYMGSAYFNTNFKMNQWYHIAATYDGDSSRTYVNSVQTNSYYIGQTLTLNNNNYFQIGYSNQNVVFDEIRISNIARTAFNVTGTGLAPGKTKDFAAIDSTSNFITLKWHAPGSDSYTGTASQYDLRKSLSPIDSSNFATADSITGLPVPSAATTVDSFRVTGLNYNTLYYFALKTKDSEGNWSKISNITSSTTEAQDLTAPATISTLIIADTSKREITLKWTAPADDGAAGRKIQGYRLYYGNSALSSTTLSSADSVDFEDSVAVGALETFTKDSLSPNTTYYFALKAFDEVPNYGGLSNIKQVTTIAVPVLTEYGWPAFHGGSQNTGFSSDIGATVDSLHWTYSTGGQISSSPAIDEDENIYVGSEDGSVYAVNSSGTLIWKKALNAGVFSSPLLGSMNTLFVGGKDKRIYCLNTTTGDTIWTYMTGSQVYSSPVLSQTGVLYTGSLDGKLYAFQSDDGKLLWTYTTGSKIYNSPALSSDEKTVYIGDQDGKVIAVDAVTGTKTWEYATNSAVYSSPAVDAGGIVYIAAQNGKVYALNTDGTLKWEYSTGSSIFYSSPALDKSEVAGAGESRLLIGDDNGELHCLNASTGIKVWSYISTQDQTIRNSPAVSSNGFIYFGSKDKKFYCLNNEGTLEWSHLTGGELYTSSPAIGPSGKIYVGSYDNKLYALGFKEIFTADPLLVSGQEYSGDIAIPYTINLKVNSNVFLLAEYSQDKGDTWNAASITGDTTDIPPADFTGKSLTWNSVTDLPGKYVPLARFRLSPRSADSTGIAGVSPVFVVDNNELPTISADIVVGEQSGDVALSFTFSDPENDTLFLSGQYQHIDSTTWLSSTLIGGVDSLITSPGSATWATKSDIIDLSGDFYLRLFTNDNDPSVPDTLAINLDNYHKQSIIIEPFTGEQQDSIVISYTLTDFTQDTLDLLGEYSLPDSLSWLPASIVGDTTNIEADDYGGSLIWASRSDIHNMQEIKNVQFRLTPSDGWAKGPADTVLIDIDNNLNPSVVITPIETEQIGDISISYLLTDEEHDLLSIDCEIKKYGETAWSAATVTGVTSEITTYLNTITWNSDSDLTDYVGYVDFRITPSDMDAGVADTIAILIDQIGAAIVQKLTLPFGELSGDVTIDYELSDDENDEITVFLEYSLDNNLTWITPEGLESGIGRFSASQYTGSYTWKSRDELAGRDIFGLLLRLKPHDGNNFGAIKQSLPLHLDNNLVPVAILQDFTQEQGGDIPLTITLTDVEDDSLELTISYLKSGETTWKTITSSDFVTPIKPSAFQGTVTWESDTDLKSMDTDVEILITVKDADQGVSDTIAFHLDNEEGPRILSLYPEKNTIMGWYESIQLNLSKPVDTSTLSGNIILESAAQGSLTPEIVLSGSDQVLTLSSSLKTNDDFTLSISTGLKGVDGVAFDGNGNGDPDGATIDKYSQTFKTALPGDYDLDETVNFDDFIIFRDAWLIQENTDPFDYELTPALGSLPAVAITPDGALNIHDFAAFGWMWTYAQTQGLGKVLAKETAAEDNGNIVLRSNYETEDIWNREFSDKLEIEIKADNLESLSATELAFWYGKEDLEFERIVFDEMEDNQSLHLIYEDKGQGLILINLLSLEKEGFLINVALGTLVFKPKTKTETMISFSADVREKDNIPVLSSGEYNFKTTAPMPEDFALHDNYPNPFNPFTFLRFELPFESQVNLVIYNLMGQEVIRLLEKIKNPGYHEIRWDGRNKMGQKVGSGMYLYALMAKSEGGQNFRKVKKMLLLK